MSADGIQKVLDDLAKKTKRIIGQERISKVRAVVAVGPDILVEYIKSEIIKAIKTEAKDKKIEPVYNETAIEKAAKEIAEILHENIQNKFRTVVPKNFTVTEDVSGEFPVVKNTTVWSVEPNDGKEFSVYNFLTL